MTKLTTFLTVSTLFLVATTHAQSVPQVGTADLASLTKLMEGSWNLKVNFEPSSEAPKGMQGVGEENWRSASQGLTLTDEESFSAGQIKMTLLGLFWTDHVTKKLQALDCNNQNPHTCGIKDALDGVAVQWNGKELIVEEPEPGPDGKMMISRIVWSDIKPSSFTETGYWGPPGGPFKKGMTLLATRK